MAADVIGPQPHGEVMSKCPACAPDDRREADDWENLRWCRLCGFYRNEREAARPRGADVGAKVRTPTEQKSQKAKEHLRSISQILNLKIILSMAIPFTC